MKLSVFYSLVAIANTSEEKETCLDKKKWKNFENKTGKLGYFVNTARRIIEHKIDRPNTQCKLISRMRKNYFQMTKLRRNCMKKYGKDETRRALKSSLALKKEQKAEKQAARELKNRDRREDADYEETFEDESQNEIFDSSALDEMDSIAESLSGKISVQSLQEYCGQDDLDEDENTDCVEFQSKKNKATKYKAEINYRIAFITKGMESWIRTYVTPVGTCERRVNNWTNRLKKMRRRVQKIRREFPANNKQLNMETTKPVDLD